MANEAKFYTGANFNGNSYSYSIGQDITFWDGEHELNDKFLSLQVFGDAEVHCYQHSNGTGIYKIYGKGNWNLSEMMGLSKFWIAAVGTDPGVGKWAMSFCVIDDVGNDDKKNERYYAIFGVAGLGTVTPYSVDKDTPKEDRIYTMLTGRGGDTSELNCGIDVFHKATNQLLASGQAIFAYDTTTGVSSLKRSSITGLLGDAALTQIDNTRFDLMLSVKPGVNPPPDDGYLTITRAVFDRTGTADGTILIEGIGSNDPNAEIWIGGIKVETTGSNGNWRYSNKRGDGVRISRGNPSAYPDGTPRFTVKVEQRRSGVTSLVTDVLIIAPDVSSPYDGEYIPGGKLPTFHGTTLPMGNVTVVLSHDGVILGESQVQRDSTWSITPSPDVELEPGEHTLEVYIVFPVPAGRPQPGRSEHKPVRVILEN